MLTFPVADLYTDHVVAISGQSHTETGIFINPFPRSIELMHLYNKTSRRVTERRKLKSTKNQSRCVFLLSLVKRLEIQRERAAGYVTFEIFRLHQTFREQILYKCDLWYIYMKAFMCCECFSFSYCFSQKKRKEKS